jgi:DNA-binding transcriptional LysR family regulator
MDKEDTVESPVFNVMHLMTLSVVAQHGSFTRAAEALGVTQPSVSQQIREIEHAAGLPVVLQKGRSITLTPLGLDLAEIGRRIAAERTRAGRVAARHKEGAEGRLTVGASMTTSAHLLPRVVSRLQRERPDATIEVRTGNTFDVAQMVTDDVVDIGVVEGDVDRTELIVTPFTNDRLVCIVSAKHHLKGEHLQPEEVRNETLLLREDGSGTRQIVLRTLASQGFHFKRTLLFGTNETIRNAVHYGIGIAWLSRISLEADLASGLIRELTFSTPPIERQFSFVRRRDTTPTPLGEAFIAALKG